MNKYCQTCGTKHENAANFCGGCGRPFPGSKAPVKIIAAQNQQEDPDDDDDSEESGIESGNLPELDSSQVVITHNKRNTLKVQDLVGTANASQTNFSRPQEPKVSRKKFLEQFKQEAGSIRPKGNK